MSKGYFTYIAVKTILLTNLHLIIPEDILFWKLDNKTLKYNNKVNMLAYRVRLTNSRTLSIV